MNELIEKDECQTVEFKKSDKLGNTFDLAKEITAFANANGGFLLIGVDDNGQIEGMTAKRGHEEYIMNIASDKCVPPVNPKFETINYSNEADVYFIHIPEGDLHAVSHDNKTHYYVRRGSTVRSMRPSEIQKRPEKEKLKSEPLTKPSDLKTRVREPELGDIMKVNATAYPGENTVETEINVKWVSRGNLSQKSFNVVFKLVFSRRTSESDLALLVEKGEFSVNSYVNRLGKDWKIVDTDSYTLKKIDNTKRFLLTVEFP